MLSNEWSSLKLVASSIRGISWHVFWQNQRCLFFNSQLVLIDVDHEMRLQMRCCHITTSGKYSLFQRVVFSNKLIPHVVFFSWGLFVQNLVHLPLQFTNLVLMLSESFIPCLCHLPVKLYLVISSETFDRLHRSDMYLTKQS